MHCSATYWHAPFVPSKTPANNPVSLSSPPLSERLPRSPNAPVHSDSAGMNYKPCWSRSRATLCSDRRSLALRLEMKRSRGESQTVVMNTTRSWGAPRHLLGLSRRIVSFHILYASFREKHVDIYFSGVIWICGVDKYLRPTRRVIYQVWSRIVGRGYFVRWCWQVFFKQDVLRNPVYLDDTVIVSLSMFKMRLYICCFGVDLFQDACNIQLTWANTNLSSYYSCWVEFWRVSSWESLSTILISYHMRWYS